MNSLSVHFKVCVNIINVAMFTLPSTSMWAHAMDVMLTRHPRPRGRGKRSKLKVPTG